MPIIAIYILLVIGGLGTFLVGMKLLQDSTEKLATGSLKKLFAKTANNKFVGVGIGMLSTMIMQSSGATTVMVVGFVNAGAMSLVQAASYIMGANIGTTITAQIVALSSLPISEIFIAFTLIGIFLEMFLHKKHSKIATAGMLICGLGLLFLGLFVMKTNMESIINQNSIVKDMLTNMSNPFILLLIGIVFTALIQSSSAVTSVILALAMAGVTVGGAGNGVLYVILGTNIGSCSTALLSSIGSTANGKRASIIHLLFNVFGSVLFFIVLICWPDFNTLTFGRWFKKPATQIAMFHTFFNIVSTLIFLPLSGLLVKLSTIIIRDKKNNQEEDFNTIIDKRFLNNPTIALNQAIIYYHKIAEISLKALNMALEGFNTKDCSKTDEIHNLEKKVQDMSKKLVLYIINVTSAGINEDGGKRISKMHHDIADIVRLSEIADNITLYTKDVVDNSLIFSDIVLVEINDMAKKINELFSITDTITEKPSISKLNSVEKLEQEIDDLRTSLVDGHILRLNEGKCQPASSGVFINLVGNLERVGDHLTFISERACEEINKQISQKRP